MARDVTGEDGITWNCVEAYAGLSESAENEAAARVRGSDGRVRVVCTPGGGAKSVRVALQEDWESKLSDEELLGEIEAHRES